MWGSTGRHYDDVSRFVASGIEHCVERLAPMPGAVNAVANGLDEDRRASARAEMAELFDQHTDGLGVSVPWDYLVTVGVRR